MGAPYSVAVGPDGSLYIADLGSQRIRKVVPNGIITTIAGTGVTGFSYDSDGRLTGVTDGDGNVTTIERDSSGNPTAIVAPGGQRTTLAVNENGFMSRIANPAGEAVQFSYTSRGLLTTKTDARGNIHRFTYDALGRLICDEDPAGGVKTLARVDTANGYEVTLTTALGRASTYSIERLTTGEVRRVNSDSVGARTTVLTAPDGSATVTAPDGTRTTIQRGPDQRFGMLVPAPTTVTHSAPGGRSMTQTSQRTVTLADPVNPLSLQTLTDTATINGRTFTSRYDAATRTMTSTSPEGRQSIAVINAQGRVVSKRLAPNLTPITVSYDAKGRLTQMGQGAQGFTYTYDGANR